ncbi:MAG: hypothetical protein HY664_01250 [Chloroflexi bacterium]|nr:hypothetical protein [Chloroflexota bacterium]
MTVLVAAFSFAFDYAGGSVAGLEPSQLRIVALITFTIFVVLTLWREIGLWLAPGPAIRFAGLSPTEVPVVRLKNNQPIGNLCRGYFSRIKLVNKCHDPSGLASEAQRLTAEINVYEAESGRLADSWMGRWADLEEANSPAEKWQADCIDLSPNGQEASLDIGMRFEDDTAFFGWDNSRYSSFEFRNPLTQKCYIVEITLRARNMRAKVMRFWLNNPTEKPGGYAQLTLKK